MTGKDGNVLQKEFAGSGKTVSKMDREHELIWDMKDGI